MRIRAERQNKGLARQTVHTATTVALLDRDGLVTLWSEIMGSPAPRGMSQALLHAFLAFEVQQRSDGGLTKADLDRLERIGIGKVRAKAPNINAGARFLREWNASRMWLNVGGRWLSLERQDLCLPVRHCQKSPAHIGRGHGSSA